MPKPFPKEFREDVVQVARSRDSKTTIEQIAKDFGIHPQTLQNWLRKADVQTLFVDSVGDVWVGTSAGVVRVSEASETPIAVPSSTTWLDRSLPGLSSTGLKRMSGAIPPSGPTTSSTSPRAGSATVASGNAK